MYTDTISIDGYGIRLDQLNLDNDIQSPLIKIALNRILNDNINDDFIGIIDDISGNHYEENDHIDINAGVLTGDRYYIYIPSAMPYEKSPEISKPRLKQMLQTALHDALLVALKADVDDDGYTYKPADQTDFEKQFQTEFPLDCAIYEDVHDGSAIEA